MELEQEYELDRKKEGHPATGHGLSASKGSSQAGGGKILMMASSAVIDFPRKKGAWHEPGSGNGVDSSSENSPRLLAR